MSSIAEGDRWLERDAAHYLARVHRLRVGDVFTAFDPELQIEAEATVVELRGPRVRCSVGALTPARLVSALDVTLLQSVGKGDKLDRVVRDATELGVRRIIAVLTERTVVRASSDSPHKRDRWRAIAAQAARQCGRGDVPDIDGPQPFAAALSRLGSGLRLLLDGSARRCLASSLEGWQRQSPLVLLIGPEGGWTPVEQSMAAEAGFDAVSLGPFTLRTETAATAALGAVLAASRVMGGDESS